METTTKKFDFNGFVRECYLRSVPSVDLRKVTGEQVVDCCKHELKLTEYEKILAEYHAADYDRAEEACNMFMLMNGPQLVDDRPNARRYA